MSDGETANKKAVGIETLSSSATDGAFLALNPAHYGQLLYSDRKCSSFTLLISIGHLSDRKKRE